MSDKFVFQSCSFCDNRYQHPSILISNYNEVWICQNCDDSLFPKNDMENGECCCCLKNTNVLKLRNCIHKICSDCFKKTNFGSNINPAQWGHLESEINMDPPAWPFEIKRTDNSDAEYVKTQEYQKFMSDHLNIQTTVYDDLIIIRNNLMSTRPEWMNSEIFIQFENTYFKYVTELIASIKGFNELTKMTKEGPACPLCSKNSEK